MARFLIELEHDDEELECAKVVQVLPEPTKARSERLTDASAGLLPSALAVIYGPLRPIPHGHSAGSRIVLHAGASFGPQIVHGVLICPFTRGVQSSSPLFW